MKPRVGTLRAMVLLLWTAFLVWLSLSGEGDRYVGSRTRWVIVFGVIVVGWAAILQVRSLLAGMGTDERADRAEWIRSTSLLIPLLTVLLIPDPRLGADAADRKTFGGSSAIGAFAPRPDPGGEVSFPEIVHASRSSEYAEALGIAEGFELELIGFVTHPSGLDGGFALTRFESFCCAADAVPYSVPIDPGPFGDRSTDEWLKVSGELVRRDGVFVLEATAVEGVEEPSDPYI